MRKPGLGSVGLGLIGLGSSLFAAPASAAIDCGTAPTGGTLTQSNGVCELTFETPGNYAFTVPTGAGQLYALVVGGGAGGFASNPFNYAGAAGKVTYKDMTDSIGAALTITIGTGGTGGSDAGAAGGTDSNVSAPSTSNTAVAYGGVAGSAPSDNYCVMPGWDMQLYVGQGARTVTELSAQGANCEDGQGAGVNPSLGDVDSAATSVPAIFSNLDVTYGTGGQIVAVPYSLSALNPGDGGGLRVEPSDDTFDGGPRNGANGIAILRWRETPTLANTGSDSGSLSALAAGLIAAGLSLTLASRVRRRTAK